MIRFGLSLGLVLHSLKLFCGNTLSILPIILSPSMEQQGDLASPVCTAAAPAEVVSTVLVKSCKEC